MPFLDQQESADVGLERGVGERPGGSALSQGWSAAMAAGRQWSGAGREIAFKIGTILIMASKRSARYMVDHQ